ncbi:hypothetical protein [Neobacillus mesonae]|uniref:Uncharacterized protein n=1 Tax=Neobacillus mesonae TaxID=1193713 RepID=A0A3T0HXH6_9BACI|nr:hypothetical protein [Neobacillus mesonae]AZU61816.1 hypothetical protein CHR53_11285 [Neobacillus mesonae]
MSDWITIFAIVIIMIAVVEELIYYIWNRYLYGKKEKRQRRWLQKLVLLISRIKKKRVREPKSNITNDVDSP